MNSLCYLGFVLVLLFSGAIIPMYPVHAQPQKTACIYEPMDLFMDKELPNIISQQVQHHNLSTKTIPIVDQLLQKDQGCDVIIKIDRAINENYRYTDKTTRYLVNQHTITIFTYKTADVFNPVSGEQLKPMTNLSCESTAHATKYHSNYHVSDSGYYSTYTGYCNPFQGYTSKTGELPYNVIRNSVDLSLAVFKL